MAQAARQELDDVMHTIATVPDSKTTSRIARTGLSTRPSISHGAPVFEQAFMSYEARLVEPSPDGAAFRFAHDGPRVDKPPPMFAEHNEEILAELGYSKAQIEGFRAAGVI